MNYAGVKTDLIDFVSDAAPSKQNKFLPGSHIPVLPPSAIDVERPDIIVIFPWNIAEEVKKQLAYAKTWGAIFVTALALVLFRIAAVIELEVYALYALVVALLYGFIGAAALQRLWFPLLYLLFAVPLPDSLVAALTNPLKIWISQSAVSLLYFLGYPIASAGVTIQIGQYQLLVAAACAGLNSLITLSALTLFYVYMSHRANWRYMAVLVAAAIPVAVFSNLMRVLLLILITYYGGEAAAQGFLHNFAGLTTFAISLVTIYVLDKLLQRVWRFAAAKSAAN